MQTISRKLARSLVVTLCMLTVASGCHRTYVVPETPLPPNTVLLSQMMRELSAQPGFTDKLLDELDPKRNRQGKRGPAVLTPDLLDELRKRIFGQDWQGLDRFPGWTMPAIDRTVRVAGHEAGKNEKLEDTAAVHPGAPASDAQTKQYLDLGPYALDKAETISLGQPSKLPAFTAQGIVNDMGDGVIRGDGPNNLAPEHAESQRLADVLNRLAANKLAGAQPFIAGIDDKIATTPEALIQQWIDAGATITVTDSRYFANFGHLHYKGQDVMMPFFINSEIVVPNSGGRPLLVPVSHAELEWHIRGPLLNADISYYFGIDGKSEWRTMDTLDQSWVLKRDAHTYTGAQAVEATRLAGLLTVAYIHEHERRSGLPFGGYYALGVCQDGVSAVERKLTGAVTLYPNTADAALFDDPRDAEVNAMIAADPNDRSGIKPQPERIFGSLPATDYNSIAIPGLAADLNAAYAAWKNGTLERTHTAWDTARAWAFLLSAAGLALYLAIRTRHLFDQKPLQRNPYRK